jgi:hypothetical protein
MVVALATVALLKSHGFVVVELGLEPETKLSNAFSGCLQKTMPAIDMPYVREHIIDNEIVGENDQATITVTPSGFVQLSIGKDYVEDAVPIEGDGAGVLRDAGVPVKSV